jgi:hypothetical protein
MNLNSHQDQRAAASLKPARNGLQPASTKMHYIVCTNNLFDAMDGLMGLLAILEIPSAVFPLVIFTFE